MNLIAKKGIIGKAGIIFFLSFMMAGCITIQPIGFQNYHLETVETIMIATDLKDTPVVNLLGVTIFENKQTYITDFDFSVNQYILTQADGILKSRGFSTLVNNGPIPENTLNDLSSIIRSTRVAAANNLHQKGADALLLIEQMPTITGLSIYHGHSLEEHGLFLVRTIAGRRDRVKIPVRITYYDLRTGYIISSEIYDSDIDKNYIEDFKHVTEVDDMTDSDIKTLMNYYIQKIDLFMEQSLSPVHR